MKTDNIDWQKLIVFSEPQANIQELFNFVFSVISS